MNLFVGTPIKHQVQLQQSQGSLGKPCPVD